MKQVLKIVMLAVVLAGCASTPSNVVCTGGSKDMTCHARVDYQEPVGRKPVDLGK